MFFSVLYLENIEQRGIGIENESIWSNGAVNFDQTGPTEKWDPPRKVHGPIFSKLLRLDRTDPFSFRPKFPEILVEIYFQSQIETIVPSFSWGIFIHVDAFRNETFAIKEGSVPQRWIFSFLLRKQNINKSAIKKTSPQRASNIRRGTGCPV